LTFRPRLKPSSEQQFRQTVPTKASVKAETSTVIKKRCILILLVRSDLAKFPVSF